MLLPFAKSQQPYDLAEQDDHDRATFFDLKRSGSPQVRSPRRRRRGSLLLLFLALLWALWFAYARITAYLAPPRDKNGFLLPGEIPNIVHFVRQLNRNEAGEAKPLRFEFRHMMAYYSAHLHLNPDEINIWTDADTDSIAEAQEHGDYYTKSVLRLPKIQFRHVEMPNATLTGFPIKLYAHKSDFVRTRVMAQYGGQYFDDDAWVIRDLAPFRKAGFDNVFGRQWFDDICQAAWMSTPNNTLMRAFSTLQETEFNGDWVKASNILLTNLARDSRGLTHDRHSLILERDAFFPGQWNPQDDGLPVFYKIHEEVDGTYEPNGPSSSEEELINRYVYERHYGWRKEWRNTYIIHGFSNAVRAEKAEWMFGRYGSFTPEYILAQSSNIARALYPALQTALDTGFLEMDKLVPPPPAAPPALGPPPY